MGYFRTPKVDLTYSHCARVNFGELQIDLGGEQTLTFVDTKRTRRLLLLTQRNSNNLIVTLARRVFRSRAGLSRRVQKMEIMVDEDYLLKFSMLSWMDATAVQVEQYTLSALKCHLLLRHAPYHTLDIQCCLVCV